MPPFCRPRRVWHSADRSALSCTSGQRLPQRPTRCGGPSSTATCGRSLSSAAVPARALVGHALDLLKWEERWPTRSSLRSSSGAYQPGTIGRRHTRIFVPPVFAATRSIPPERTPTGATSVRSTSARPTSTRPSYMVPTSTMPTSAAPTSAGLNSGTPILVRPVSAGPTSTALC